MRFTLTAFTLSLLISAAPAARAADAPDIDWERGESLRFFSHAMDTRYHCVHPDDKTAPLKPADLMICVEGVYHNLTILDSLPVEATSGMTFFCKAPPNPKNPNFKAMAVVITPEGDTLTWALTDDDIAACNRAIHVIESFRQQDRSPT